MQNVAPALALTQPQLKATKIFRSFLGRDSFLLDSSIWPELIKGQQGNLCRESPLS